MHRKSYILAKGAEFIPRTKNIDVKTTARIN